MNNEELVLSEIRKHLKTLSADDQIEIECIAMTFRNCIKAKPVNAGLALALVGAELAAS